MALDSSTKATAYGADFLQIRHVKDKQAHSSNRKFNTQVGDLFHNGMGLRDPKGNWRGGERQAEPHRSHEQYLQKKYKHLVPHHDNGKYEPKAYQPRDTTSRTLEVGKPAKGCRVDMPASPHPASPNTPGGGYQNHRSQQELALLKRRHMTDIDGTTTKESFRGSPKGAGSPTSPSWQKAMGHAQADMVPAGTISKGGFDLLKLEPTREHVPHKSVIEFSLKKEQHLTSLHRSPRDDPRFR